MMNKKAALQLSINAIVVLILAITILGLGLGFITKQFGAVQKKFEDVGGQIEKQLIEEMERSGELLVLNQVKVTAKSGDETNIYIGVRNTYSPDSNGGAGCNSDEVAVSLNFTCTNEMGEDACAIADWDTWFTTFNKKCVDKDEVAIFPVEITPRKSGTFEVEVEARYDLGANQDTIDDKVLFLTVS